MAIIPLRQTLETVQACSTMELAVKAGLLAGCVHHFTCQHRRQATVTTSLAVWVANNVFLLTVASFLVQSPTFLRLIAGSVVFNTVYVCPLQNNIDMKKGFSRRHIKGRV